MTENPYAPPSAELDGGNLSGGSEGRGDFEIGICLSDAWAGTWANFPLWLFAFLSILVLSLLSVVTVVGLVLALPHLMYGSAYLFLRMHDREAEFGDIFVGFSDYGRVLVNAGVMLLIVILLQIASQSVELAGEAVESDSLILLGSAISLAFTFLVSPRLSLAYFYLVDQDATGVESLKRSWERTRPGKWKCIGLILLTIVISIAGLLVLIVGIIPASIMAYLMWASAYRQIEGKAASA